MRRVSDEERRVVRLRRNRRARTAALRRILRGRRAGSMAESPGPPELSGRSRATMESEPGTAVPGPGKIRFP